MKNLASEWETYRKFLLAGRAEGPVEEARQAYYAGALAALKLLEQESGDPEITARITACGREILGQFGIQ